ncbi:MAG TPA: gamma-glutamyltransferase [Isosphaeraceae bacterium]|nr:gamma-glutamyltransferase [Isosphaeraceae bacterium]
MPHRPEFASCLLIVLVVVLAWLGLNGQERAWGQDRPAGPLHKTRSAVMARQGMAATSQPLATMTAIRVLQHGGNAVDAAIAANAVLGVVEPMSCGIGGDLFAIVWDAKAKRLIGLNASGRSPAATSIELFKIKGLTAIPTHGPLSWSVPGCVDGWDQLRNRFGTKALSELLAPAIEYAEIGFPVSEIIAADWRGAEPSLKPIPTSAACFLPRGHAPEEGSIFRNPGLARSLRTIAQDGRDAFYRGPLADAIVRYSQSVGGLFSNSDFAEHTSNFLDPVSTNYRGYDVWELPPNTQGIAVLQMLNLLEPFDLKSMGPQSAEALHLMIEAKKLAYEDRAKFYADPDFAKLPIATLISKPYANRRRAELNPDKANLKPMPGDPAQADTIYLTVVDKDFNCVSLIQSNFHGFGSHHVPLDLGFVIQNRGSLFALDPKHLNRLEPRKRPFQTIIPGFITKAGQPWLSFGVMGGDMQAQGHAQVICNLIDFGMDVQEAGDAARFRHFGSSEPTGQPAKGGGMVALESGISAEVRRQLEAKGHRLVKAPGTYGGYQAIRIDLEHGVLSAGSDPRKDGAAMGY